MLSHICNSDDVDLCKQILAITSIVYRPITLTELTSFVKMLENMADDHVSLVVIIGLCGSFLALRETTVYFSSINQQWTFCSKRHLMISFLPGQTTHTTPSSRGRCKSCVVHYDVTSTA
ncbi:hypothetical protein DL98DRAFT_618167 [Cadophora sp. DSE1049]|nr:hypothetical protein DL98DRAFT_618167 [Cadophora sp. DSE1049]